MSRSRPSYTRKTTRAVSISSREPLSDDERQQMVSTPDHPRPATRAECMPGGEHHYRPCPFVGCRHHLFIDVTVHGTLKLNHAERDLMDLEETCSLDVAALGPNTLEEVGSALNITRERTRQIEVKAVKYVGARRLLDAYREHRPHDDHHDNAGDALL